MEYYLGIPLGIVILICVFLTIKLFKDKNQKDIRIKDNKNLESKVNELKLTLKDNILNLNLREGFYDKIFKLAITESSEDVDQFETKIFVIELEKYTNGYSKIKLVKTDVLNGFKIDKYDWVRELSERKFSSIVKTSDITWLEVDEDIAELRKEKLTRLLKEIE